MSALTLILILFVEIGLQSGFLLLLPAIGRSGLLFGRYVGEGAGSAAARAIGRAWRMRLLRDSLALFGFALLLVLAGLRHESLLLLPLFVPVAAFLGYLEAHRAAAALASPAPRVSAAVLGDAALAGSSFSALPFAAIALNLVAGGLALRHGLIHYEQLPPRIPIHFGLNGEPDGWAAKSFAPIVMLPLLQTILGLGLAATAILVIKGKSAIRVEASGVSAWAQSRFKRATARYLASLALVLTAMFTVGQVSTIDVALERSATLSPWFIAISIAMILFSLGGALHLALRYGQGGARLEERVADRPLPDSLANDDFWRLGFIYSNPDDPAFLVEHRFGLGYTINVGNPKAVLMLASFLVLYIGAVIVIALLL